MPKFSSFPKITCFSPTPTTPHSFSSFPMPRLTSPIKVGHDPPENNNIRRSPTPSTPHRPATSPPSLGAALYHALHSFVPAPLHTGYPNGRFSAPHSTELVAKYPQDTRGGDSRAFRSIIVASGDIMR
ncbi:hypothetical protein H5410_005037 [Solanum commersonii]|uniref:Uncharacterized protein n=1 Tax=Solanum commersonii TaxID=4109 RepID=A0A9J6A6A7_SOLCO|nr:hypothetical protein H5410_005037 [Solanum commersonii]